jgi:thiamine kinase-like enzyme
MKSNSHDFPLRGKHTFKHKRVTRSFFFFFVQDVHTHINPEAYKQETEKPEMDFIRDAITTLTTAFHDCMARVETYQGTLPMQLIHGDLHYDNVLVAETQDRVSGVLDFEFAAYDWRAMELAVCLSKYAAEEVRSATPGPVDLHVSGSARAHLLALAAFAVSEGSETD